MTTETLRGVCETSCETLLNQRLRTIDEYVSRSMEVSNMIRNRVNMIANFNAKPTMGGTGTMGDPTNQAPSVEQRLLSMQTAIEILLDDLNDINSHLESII